MIQIPIKQLDHKPCSPLSSVFIAIFWVILLPVALTTLYRQFPKENPVWLAPIIINASLIGIVLLVSIRARHRLTTAFSWPKGGAFFLPGVLILSGCLLGLLASSFWGTPKAGNFLWHSIFIFTWIPLVEECLFRVFVGDVLKRYVGIFVGGYLSALTFALCHSMPDFADLWPFSLGVPIGPLLLGVCCEYLWIKSQSLWPAVVFHCVCNATGALFLYFDGRWLGWLEALYW